jgi:chemotaxis protein MotA
MNRSTLIGALVGFVVLTIAIFLQTRTAGISIFVFWNFLSLLIVLGGVIAATFIAYPFADVLSVMKGFRLAMTRDELPVADYVREIEGLSGDALRRGSARLAGAAEEAENYFLEDGLRMVIDKYPPEEIREIMTSQINHTYHREMGEARIFRTMAKLSPAFGVVGTLIGLVIMMQGLDPKGTAMLMKSLGSDIATALLTTSYGVLLSNLIFFPIAVKVEKLPEEKIILMNIIMEGTLLILEKMPPALVQDRLKSFLPPRKRASIKQRGESPK